MFLINLQGKDSIYEQIRNQIIKFIDIGILKPNDRLPSCRELANQLGINPNTVNKAYAELEKNGYIYTVYKKGVFVSKDINEKKIDDLKQAFYVVQSLMNEGYSKEELLSVIGNVYGGNDDATDK